MARQKEYSRKIKRHSLAPLVALLVVVIAGCSAALQVRRLPKPPKLLLSQDIPFKPSKALYSLADSTLYVANYQSSKIHLYKNGKRVNTIGGPGSEQANFRKLTDIALDTDGKLLALDSPAATVKKFGPQGDYLSSIKITSCNRPQLFSVNPFGRWYVWDVNRREIFTFDQLSPSASESFGRFITDNPTALSAYRQSLVVQQPPDLLVFSSLGRLNQQLALPLLVDARDIVYIVAGNVLQSARQKDVLYTFNSEPVFYHMGSNVWTLATGNQVKVLIPQYETTP